MALRARKGNVGGLFNGKIAPLIPYADSRRALVSGRGELTPRRRRFTSISLPLLVKDWRTRWGCEFPFAWVQLPNFERRRPRLAARARGDAEDAQLPKTGMAITIDIGEAKDIHPKNKQEVGRRLSLWALGTVYGKKVASDVGAAARGARDSRRRRSS